MSFSVGDKVRTIDPEKISGPRSAFGGQICTIKHTTGNPMDAFIYEVFENNYSWTEEELELVRDIDDVKRFNVGDLVLIARVDRKGGLYKTQCIGSIGKVENVFTSLTGDHPIYKLSGIDTPWWVQWTAGELELYEEIDISGAELMI